MSYDIITIGDTTIDVFLDIDESTKLCSLDAKKEWLRLRYGSKIPVKHVDKVVGVGNAANVAVGAARLGLKTAIYTVLGDDAKGRDIQKKFKVLGIGADYIKIDLDTDTNLSTVIDYQDDRTILVHHEDRTYRLPAFALTQWIYFSSICGNHDTFNRALARYVRQKKIRLGFNPGSMQLRLGASRLAPILAVTEIIFVDVQEAQRLVGKIKDIRKLLRAVKKLGPKIVAITDGRNGSYCFDGEEMWKIGIIDLPILERTGCGDAYASGFVSALHYGLPVTQAMRWGSANGAYEAVEFGSQSGILTKSEIEALLRRHSHFQPYLIPT